MNTSLRKEGEKGSCGTDRDKELEREREGERQKEREIDRGRKIEGK